MMPRTVDSLAGIFVSLADIDEGGTVAHQFGGTLW
jgi:hypothetical protein